MVDRELVGLLLVGLEGSLRLDGGAVGQGDIVGAEQRRVIGSLVVRAQSERLGYLAGFFIVVDIALVLGGDVGKHLAGTQERACRVARVHQEGQIGPLGAELLVVELLVDNVARPVQHHGNVGAGANRQPHVGAGSVGGVARVDDHRLGARGAQLNYGTTGRRGCMLSRAGAPHHVGVDGHGGVVQLGAAGVGDGGVTYAVDQRHGVVARQVALRATRLEHVARAPEVAETRRAEELRVAAAALVLAALAHAAHGVLVAVGVIQRLNAREALGAHSALGHGVGRVAFELDDAAVLHVRDDAAVRDAGAARRVHELDLVSRVRLVAFDQIVHGGNARPQCSSAGG